MVSASRISFVGIFAAAVMLCGCGGTKSSVVAEIGKDPAHKELITIDEFNEVYAKNNGGKDSAQSATTDEKAKFLDLYVNFKLKVKEAYERGYDKDPEIQSELQDYRRNLSVSYLMNKEINEPQIRQIYDRRLDEIRASHIVIRVSPSTSPADTAVAFATAMKILDSLKTGRSFEELAVKNSQDPSAVTNKGDLYYFSSSQMVPEFEDAVYSLKIGEVVKSPVRTQFGYHIIKVTDRKANPGSVKVSHIMRRLTKESTASDSATAWKEMRGALDSLQNGAKWEAVVSAVSDDTYSKENGGDLGFIARRRTVQEFDKVAFSLKKGEMSGVVATPYGLHIIKVTDTKPIPPFKEMEAELRQFYQQYMFESIYSRFVSDLKKQYGFSVDSTVLTAWYREADTVRSTNDPGWDSSITAGTRGKTIVVFAGQQVPLDSILHLAAANPELRGLPVRSKETINSMMDKISKNLLIEYRARGLEKSYPEFAVLMNEYKEGVLLFRAEQAEVWNKVAVNDSLLHIYFDAHRANFTWPDRVNVQEIYLTADSLQAVVSFLLNDQKMPFDSVAVYYNTRETTKDKRGEWGLLPVTTNGLTHRASNMERGQVSQFFPFENGFSIIKVLERDPARDKTFKEAGTELSSAFQEYESKRLSEAWVNWLRSKYTVVLHPEILVTPKDAK
ncbi:MAG: peptidylprolyl isomerase [Ignavibacteriales bacterium]|nr:peptidylprolyl isomerase [Ignavibacteriales bacterium]